MKPEEIIERIFQTLQRQKFADFYASGGAFGRWIEGDINAPSKEEVKQEIAKLFNIELPT